MARTILRHWPLVLAFAALGASAQVGPDDPVLVENATAKVYRSDYEAELLKLPAEIRPGFANNQKRIGDLLTRLLVQKTLASQAEKEAAWTFAKWLVSPERAAEFSRHAA